MEKIEDIFKDNLFRLFLDYCKKNDIVYLEELTEKDFENIRNIKGFGTGKFNKLIEKSTEILNKNILENAENLLEDEDVVIHINKEYLDFKVDILTVFQGINSKLIEQIKECGFLTLEDLAKNINEIKELIPTLGIKKKKNIILALEQFNVDRDSLFRNLFSEIKRNPYYSIAIERTIFGKTLNEIGEERGITRERVRQKEKKINSNLEKLILNFSDFSKLKDKILSIEELINLKGFKDEDKEILKGALKNERPENITYIEGFDKFLINGNINRLKKDMEKQIGKLEDVINIQDLEKLTKAFNREIKSEDLMNLLIKNGYKEKNNYLIKGIVLKSKIYSIIVKEYFKDGITFSNEEDMAKFKKILFEKFSIESDTDRSIKAIIERNCIACDRGKYVHPTFVNINLKLLDKIKEFILENPQKTLYTHQIYSEFKEELNKEHINNRYFLHGLLGYYYKDIFKFSKDTVWRGPKKQSKNYIFNNYIKDKKRVVTKAEMEEDLKGWTSIMFTLAIEECREVLKWSRGEYIHFSMLYFSKEEVNELEKNVDKILKEKHILTSDELYDIIKDKENLGFLENNIDTGFKLFSILLYFFKEKYKFKRPNIEL